MICALGLCRVTLEFGAGARVAMMLYMFKREAKPDPNVEEEQ